MSAFKAGQRVRVVADRSPSGEGQQTVGMEGLIVRVAVEWSCGGWIVHVPGTCGRATIFCAPDEWHCVDSELAPLTDPRASEFIGDMERFAIAAKKVTA